MLAEHPSAKMCSHAVACLSYFVPVSSQSLFVHLNTFIATLFKLASDDDPSKLMPEMANVAEHMLYSTKDKNENKTPISPSTSTLLRKVAPVLLDCMIYGEDDLLWFEGDAEDTAVLDKDTDIKPRHYGGGKSHGLERDANSGTGNPGEPPKSCIGAYGEETIDSDVEDKYDLDDKMSTEWNLRKCAAAVLDVLAPPSPGFAELELTATGKEDLSNFQECWKESGARSRKGEPWYKTPGPAVRK
ncbi:hypothetical protein B0H16DRAFT_1724391 [Mycena metata]|uniref:Uncharacterized protein n=1 Tax=Mycena metata TaxID=1033252 RepID=A0AAD7IWQ2_9AGAR|nr:hypothetical protein B0H16DRAFT_1724391 [Mycena metata]